MDQTLQRKILIHATRNLSIIALDQLVSLPPSSNGIQVIIVLMQTTVMPSSILLALTILIFNQVHRLAPLPVKGLKRYREKSVRDSKNSFKSYLIFDRNVLLDRNAFESSKVRPWL